MLTQEQRTLAKQEGTLCPKCQGKGYKGRLGVYELMPVNKEIKEAIKEGRTSAEIEDAAVQSGMKTLKPMDANSCWMGSQALQIFRNWSAW